MRITAVIYMPEGSGRDPHFHARQKCRSGGIRINDGGSYRVNRVEHAIDVGRKPCPGCWTLNGYEVGAEMVAA